MSKEKKDNDNYIEKDAKFSSCNLYRYSLKRIWAKGKKEVLFIMINPTKKADENTLDQTITRCVNMFKNNPKFEHIGGVFVLNLFPYRDPKITNLIQEPKNIKEEHIEEIKQFRDKDHLVIAALGSENKIPKDLKAVFHQKVATAKEFFPNMKCLRKLKNGDPKHPLFAKYPETEKKLVQFSQ